MSNVNEGDINDEYEGIEMDKGTMHQAIDWLKKDTISAIEQQSSYYGLYIVENKPNENSDNEDDVKQIIIPISISDVVDFSKKPPIMKDNFIEQKIVTCDRDGKVKFYGNVQILQSNIKEEVCDMLVPSIGALYENGKLTYKGLFSNGNKTQGITYKEGFNEELDIDALENDQQSFFYDHRGDLKISRHTDKDLLIVYGNDEMKDDIFKTYLEEYGDNVIIRDCTNIQQIGGLGDDEYDKTKITNLTIKVDNGYEYDFKRKNTDYLDKNGDPQMYSAKDEDKMEIYVDGIIESIRHTIEEHPNLRNLEIQVLNNFGFAKDDIGNDLMKKISSLHDVLSKNDVSLFVHCVNKDNLVAAEKNEYFDEKNAGTEKQAQDNLFFYLDKKKAILQEVSNVEYDEMIKKAGFYANVFDDNLNEDSVAIHNQLCDVNVLRVEEQKKEKKIATKQLEYIEKLKKEEAKLNNEKYNIKPLEYKEQKKTKLTLGDYLLIGVSSIIFPIAGGFITYYFLTKSDYDALKENDGKKKVILIDNDGNIISNPVIDDRRGVSFIVNNDLNNVNNSNSLNSTMDNSNFGG